jgi:hypothetical protein
MRKGDRVKSRQMKLNRNLFFILFLILFLQATQVFSREVTTLYVIVALCDNKYQGIVKVSQVIGNGQDPKNNLYWGAIYGVKTFFTRSSRWKKVSCFDLGKSHILESCVFRHKKTKKYMIAEAYDGREIKRAVRDYLKSLSGKNRKKVILKMRGGRTMQLAYGGYSPFVAFVGHNGLMDFHLDSYPVNTDGKKRDAVILACASKSYFQMPLKRAGAYPLIWTNGLLAPEAYILHAVLEGWLKKESPQFIHERAYRAYHKYQRCGLKGARGLFTTGW